MSVRVALEVAPKRTFATALDWPGWSRGARAEEDALQALLDYGPRYAAIARRAKVAFTPPKTLRGLQLVDRLSGGGATEFGIPSLPSASDDDPMTPAELRRQLALLQAVWDTFDATARGARGVQLRLGPRGGGRQVAKIIDHVTDAEAAYLGQLGSRAPTPARGSSAETLRALRATFVEAVTARAQGAPLKDPNKVRKPWSPRYAIRRSAWHTLDHAWEIEDRS